MGQPTGIWFRVIALGLVIVNNVALAAYMGYRVQYTQKKISRHLLVTAYGHMACGTLQCAYNLGYRFWLPRSAGKRDCFWSDVFDEWLIVVARGFLFLFYTWRLQISFRNSSYKLNARIMNALRVVYLVVMVGGNLAWIHFLDHHISVHKSALGVYCRNGGQIEVIVALYGVDLLVSAWLLYAFVERLYKVERNVQRKMTATNRSSTLLATARNNAILTAIGIVSTWVLFLSSILSSFPVEQIRWIWVIDWAITSWCIFLMLRLLKPGDCKCLAFCAEHMDMSWLLRRSHTVVGVNSDEDHAVTKTSSGSPGSSPQVTSEPVAVVEFPSSSVKREATQSSKQHSSNSG